MPAITHWKEKQGASLMKLQFKHQKFQADAAKAVVDVFAGQPYLTPTYMMDRGYGQQTMAASSVM